MHNNKDLFDLTSERRYFVGKVGGATTHWFFYQGIEAIQKGLYLPGILSLINGIEASLRITMHRLEKSFLDKDLDPYQILNNSLIRQARNEGLPIQYLAFPDEKDFLSKLETKKPVKIVALRNNLCHGNIKEFVNRELGDDIAFFTPECLLPITDDLVKISREWADELSKFTSTRSLKD